MLAPAGACVGPVYEPGDLFDDEHVVARSGVLGIDGSEERVVANPLRFGTDGPKRAYTATGPPVAAGEHTEDALLEAGFTPGEIDDLRASGAV